MQNFHSFFYIYTDMDLCHTHTHLLIHGLTFTLINGRKYIQLYNQMIIYICECVQRQTHSRSKYTHTSVSLIYTYTFAHTHPSTHEHLVCFKVIHKFISVLNDTDIKLNQKLKLGKFGKSSNCNKKENVFSLNKSLI